VLRDRPLQVPAQTERARPVAADLIEQLPVQLAELRVSRRVDEPGVECRVRLEKLVDLISLGVRRHVVDQSLERSEVLRLEPPDRELDRHSLERFPYLVQLEEFLLRQRADHGATSRSDSDQTLRREPTDRLADRASAHAQLLGERDLRELRARLQTSGQDCRPQVVVDALPERQVLNRHRAAAGGLGGHCIHSPDGLG
jgi:hypothetical protein